MRRVPVCPFRSRCRIDLLCLVEGGFKSRWIILNQDGTWVVWCFKCWTTLRGRFAREKVNGSGVMFGKRVWNNMGCGDVVRSKVACTWVCLHRVNVGQKWGLRLLFDSFKDSQADKMVKTNNYNCYMTLLYIGRWWRVSIGFTLTETDVEEWRFPGQLIRDRPIIPHVLMKNTYNLLIWCLGLN